MKRQAVVVSLCVLSAGAVASFFALNRTSGRTPAEQETIVHPEERAIASVVNATGIVRLRVGSEVRVGSQLSGIVQKLNVTVGSHVEEGDVIAEIDNRTLRARIADSEAQAELDHVAMERARVNYERAQLLATKKVVAAQEEEDLRLALAEAKAKYEKSLRAAEVVKVDLNYATIRAPIGGSIASISTQKGETVAAAFAAPTFVTIIADHSLQLVAVVDENDIASVQKGNSVTFTVEAFPARDFSGVVESIAPKATIVSGVVNYEVTISFRDEADGLRPDMTANVTVQTAQHQALLLPASAVRRESDATVVYLSGKSGRERRPVALGAKENGQVEIRKGLAAGDAVLMPPAQTGEKKI